MVSVGNIGVNHGDTRDLVLIWVIGANVVLVGPGHARLGVGDGDISRFLVGSLLCSELLSLRGLDFGSFARCKHLSLEGVGQRCGNLLGECSR